MNNSITDIPGILVGHADDRSAGTGCTVILCENGAVAGVDVRGGAPGTRETDCLQPVNAVPMIHAVYLSGGSAFGLDGASGVVRYLESRGIGYDVGVGTVPIVPGAVLFDLTVGDPRGRPDPAMGEQACRNAGISVLQGNVGAGTGAAIGKAAGVSYMMKGGVGTASASAGELHVGAIAAVNCYGDVRDPDTGEILAGAVNSTRDGFADSVRLMSRGPRCLNPFTATSTTLAVVATNARLSKADASRVAIMAQDGLARAVVPAHTPFDGDTVFALSTGTVEADLAVVGTLAAVAVSNAIVNAVRSAASAYGLPGHAEMQERSRAGRRGS
ncbi:MAG TPA: P1 family peptidase [Spirochaetia bacterium]|nr:P1 family peptidase [Spirochaetia bacterium]